MKTAIVLGATGLTGSYVLENLLKDERYSKIKLFSRKPVGFVNSKIEEHIIDLFELKKIKSDFTGDEVYCCIGTTKRKTPDKKTYRKVDHGIPVTAAKQAKKNGIPSFLVISSMGANFESKIFYNKIKGEMENNVLHERIEKTFIFQPSLIDGERNEKRPLESSGKKIMSVLNYFMLGPLKKYRSIHPEIIGQAMVYVANNGTAKTRIKSDKIQELAKTSRNA